MNPGYVAMMATYNAEMNRRLYASAGRLPDAERRRDRGAFWHSLHGTLAHLLWGDRMWMCRFDGWRKPVRTLEESDREIEDFAELEAERVHADECIEEWAARVDQAWLDQDLTWYSHAANREMRKSRAMLVVHFFNHQTHHRGQAHVMLTAAGERTGSTDLMLIV